MSRASIDDVLTLWAGLGYYTRARNLHRCAQMIVHHYNGKFPETIEDMQTLPGIGRSTAGAVLAFSKDFFAPILDGNVRRVLCRAFGVYGQVNQTSTMSKLWALAEQYTPRKNVADYTQAMMDLGAMCCTRTKPDCQSCPVKEMCFAFKHNTQNKLPEKKVAKVLPKKTIYWLVLQNKNHQLYLVKRPPVGIWGGLWSFPEYDSLNDIKHACQHVMIKKQEQLNSIQHRFSHYELTIYPVLVEITSQASVINEADQSLWYDAKSSSIGVPKPVKSLLLQLEE